MNLQRLTDVALRAAQAGADVAGRGFHHVRRIEAKQGAELLTEFDIAAEKRIVQILRDETPDIPIVAEEGGGDRHAPLAWYVDPIDGTTNFAHGHPFWCVSIGLVRDGKPELGAVVAPALGSTWKAWRDGGCFRDEQPCRVSTIDRLDQALLTTGFAYDRRTARDNNVAEFGQLIRHAIGIRRCGSAALDLCFVACGVYDGYWERKLKPWDIAAGVALVEQAGGTVSSWSSTELRIQAGEIVATNGHIHRSLVEQLQRGRKSMGE